MGQYSIGLQISTVEDFAKRRAASTDKAVRYENEVLAAVVKSLKWLERHRPEILVAMEHVKAERAAKDAEAAVPTASTSNAKRRRTHGCHCHARQRHKTRDGGTETVPVDARVPRPSCRSDPRQSRRLEGPSADGMHGVRLQLQDDGIVASLAGQPGRTSCLVSGCGRSWPDDGIAEEIICGKHWRMVPVHLRNEAKRLRAGWRKARRANRPKLCGLYANDYDRVWSEIKASITGEDRPAGTRRCT